MLLAPFGREVVRRKVIFLDLAVGQWAALGAATASVVWGVSFLWLGALVGALLAAALVRRLSHATQGGLEAPIGLLYALALALFMLLQATAGSQREIVSALIAYDVLFASPDQAIIALVVALLAWVLWIKFDWLQQQGFYWGFALVCAFAVKLAGVLVVFALLLAPALMLMGRPIWQGMLLGITMTWLGMGIALWFDLPAGYTLVALLTTAALTVQLFERTNREPLKP